MNLLGELRNRAKHIVGPVLGATIFAYFVYHSVQGDRGLIAWIKLSQQVTEAQLEYDAVEARRADLARRVSLMEPAHLDPDLLDERARLTLGYLHPDEVVIPLRGAGPRSEAISPVRRDSHEGWSAFRLLSAAHAAAPRRDLPLRIPLGHSPD